MEYLLWCTPSSLFFHKNRKNDDLTTALAHQMFTSKWHFLNVPLLQFKAKITSSECLVVYLLSLMDHELIQIK